MNSGAGRPRGDAQPPATWRGRRRGDRARRQADTFPKLLIHNAETRGGRIAMRHKDLGIWQTWTWAQMLDEVRAFSVGLEELGLKRGDKIAIIGANRPRLYWAMCAGQALGAVPVPIYADFGRRRDGLCARARRGRRSRSSRIRSRSTRSCRSRTACRQLRHIVYDEPRGLARLRPRAADLDRRRAEDRAREARRPGAARALGSSRSRRARAPTSRSSSTPPAPPGARRA